MQRMNTQFRRPLRPELRFAGFLMCVGGHIYSQTASKLGIGCSRVYESVHDTSKLVVDWLMQAVKLPLTELEQRI